MLPNLGYLLANQMDTRKKARLNPKAREAKVRAAVDKGLSQTLRDGGSSHELDSKRIRINCQLPTPITGVEDPPDPPDAARPIGIRGALSWTA